MNQDSNTTGNVLCQNSENAGMYTSNVFAFKKIYRLSLGNILSALKILI
jgi:hypothetical protein